MAAYLQLKPKAFDLVKELAGGGKYDIEYFAGGCASPGEAELLAEADAPTSLELDGVLLVRQSIRASDTGVVGTYDVQVKYGSEDDEKSKEPPEPGTYKIAFDTTGGTHKLMGAKSMVAKYSWSMGDTAPDTTAINWNGKEIEGVEVPVAALKITVTRYYDPTQVTTELMRNLARKTPRMNDGEWLGFEAGELLYLGATGEGDYPTLHGQRVKPIGIQLKFDASENRTNIVLSSDITVTAKKGWDYLSVQYMKYDDGTHYLPRPRFAWVLRIHEELDFAAFFGFGGTP